MSASHFATLHAELLVLKNSWDALSARIAEREGAKAIATTSAAVAWANGYPDGEKLPFEEHVRVVRAIARVVGLPISVDIERGYSDDPREVAENCARLVDAGACGVNLEDAAAPAGELAEKIRAVKSRLGSDIFVNARTDLLLRGQATKAELLERARIYEDAGADGFFVMRLTDPELMSAIAAETRLPLNVPGNPDPETLSSLAARGVRRVSAGPAIALAAHATTYPSANALFTGL